MGRWIDLWAFLLVVHDARTSIDANAIDDYYLMAALNPKNTMICHPNRFVL